MKKLFKNSYIALAVLALGFSACTEQVDYNPAEVPTTDQVYFSNANPATIDILQDATSFDLLVGRINTKNAASVAVTVEADTLANELFIFPETIEFAENDTVALYTITVKEGAVLAFEQYYNIKLTIEDGYATSYGIKDYSFKVGVPAPWSDWTKFGEGTYVYTGSYWGGELTGAVVYYREYLLNDVDAQFLVTSYDEDSGEEAGMAGGFRFQINYNKETGNCQVLPQQVAVNSNYGPVFVCDPPHYPLQEGLTYEKFPCTYDKKQGLFSLNVVYFVSTALGSSADGMFGNGVETIQLEGFYVPDYSLALEYKGHYVDVTGVDNAVISVAKGVDVAKYLMAVVSTDEDANAVLGGMLDGTVPCDTLKEGGFYAYPMTESGNYQALAIAYNDKDSVMGAYSTEFEFFLAGQENPWESLGYAMYTDDIMVGFLKEPKNYSYRVEVLANNETPGLYRIMHPCAFFGADTSKDYYIEIDATDPEGVWIEDYYEIGLDLGAGAMSVTSNAWYQADAAGATKEAAKEAGLCGVLAENVITFPAKGLVIAMGGKPYSFGNVNGAFKLDLGNITATPDEEEAKAPVARMFNADIKPSKASINFKKIDNSFLSIKGCEIE